MVRISRGVSALVLALTLAAPVSAQNRREMQMMADIRMLQEQTQQLQLQLQTSLTALSDALKTINARLDDQTSATRKAFADQKLAVDQLGSDLRVVRERVDETNVRISSLSQELEALRLSIPPAPPVPSSIFVDPSAGTPPADPAAAASPAPAATPPPLGPGMSPQRLFDTAWADYTAGQWTLCVEGFSTYLRTFPRSELADEAQSYIGECHYSDGKFQEAVDAFTRVITSYPKADAASVAYYKRGLAFDRLGQPERARESWEALIKAFPDSDAARLAKQNLDRLNRGRP